MPKRCSVACDTPAGILLCELDLPDDATIAVALSGARRVLGDSAADWERAATGIYGRVYSRTHIPVHGDRIELYRPLKVDPRAKRRARAAQAQRAPRRG
ncbi:MAG TPA: RnfH family protein [Steroidobacteraceae bacterium]|nr:RnfH family protein [Steroidobacteraceae bacterium]